MDKSKYIVDLEAKMATLREEMFTQMGVIKQVNHMQETERLKRLELIKRMKIKHMTVRKLSKLSSIRKISKKMPRHMNTKMIKNPFSIS